MSGLIMRACATAGVAGVIIAFAGLVTGSALTAAAGIGLIVVAYGVAVRTDAR